MKLQIALTEQAVAVGLSPHLMRRGVLGLILAITLICRLHSAIPLIVPPEPKGKPAVISIAEVDKDNNLIEDIIDTALADAAATINDATATAAEVADAKSVLDKITPFIFSFNRQIMKDEIDAFIRLGGEVTLIFQANYGWIGNIARAKIPAVVKLMHAGFAGVTTGDKQVIATLHVATRTGRVRQQWASGYNGNANITIAILDTGISGSHSDLTGRQQYWHDYTTIPGSNPATLRGRTSAIDIAEHGTHVAGIALGTGNASGANPTTLQFTDANTFDSRLGYSLVGYTEVPTTASSFQWNGTMSWVTTAPPGKTASLEFDVYQSSGAGAGLYRLINPVTSSSTPFTSSLSSVANPTVGQGVNSSLFYNHMWAQAGTFTSADKYAVATTFTALNGTTFGVGDGFNLERGVASSCRWAGMAVLQDDGNGTGADLLAGIEDLPSLASANNIKIANLSLAENVLDPILRAHVNTAVASGIFVVIAAGNTGPNGHPAGASMTDPATAGLAMTVGAANTTQLTDYTTYGITTGDTTQNQDVIKPDVMAPGGSTYYGYIMSVDSNDSDAGTSGFTDVQNNDYSLKEGTSMAAPFVAGCAALVIDAWQQTGHTWSFASSADPLFIKMLLCATATESNQGREYDPTTPGPGLSNPTLGRAVTPKDPAEGYGNVNVDAAIECLRRPPLTFMPITETLGNTRFDKRASGFNVPMTASHAKAFQLSVPSGADFDMYLYSSSPDGRGNPQILTSATSSSLGGTETMSYTPTSTGTYYLVVKQVSGSGDFTLQITTAPTFTDLSVLFAGTFSYAFGVNQNAQVAGYGDNGYPTLGTVRAFEWANGFLTDLCPNCPDTSYGYAINDSQLIVGDDVYSGTRGFKWTSASGFSTLGTLYGDSRARAVNNSGVIAGYSVNSVGVNRAVRWPAGQSSPTDLKALAGTGGSFPSYAYGINDDGYIVGQSRISSGQDHAFSVLPNSTIDLQGSDLGTLGGASSTAYAVNASHQVAGGANTTGGAWHAFFKKADSGTGRGFTDLGVLGGTTSSTSYGINKFGQIVGQSDTTGFIWQSGQAMQSLSTITGKTIVSAQGINDAGQVVGWYSTQAGNRGFILTPAP